MGSSAIPNREGRFGHAEKLKKAQSTESLDSLRLTPFAQLPRNIQIALALKGALSSAIDPSENSVKNDL
jgi:hypothetical protein